MTSGFGSQLLELVPGFLHVGIEFQHDPKIADRQIGFAHIGIEKAPHQKGNKGLWTQLSGMGHNAIVVLKGKIRIPQDGK